MGRMNRTGVHLLQRHFSQFQILDVVYTSLSEGE
jgi:hypothetical protein